MIFRPATSADLPRILTILDAAIRRLGAQGIDQWQHGYPNRKRIEEDLREASAMCSKRRRWWPTVR